MRVILLFVSLSVAALAYNGEAPAAVPVNLGWGTDNVIGGAGNALYSDASYTQRLVGLGMGGSFATNDYVQLIVDVDGDGFAPPDFTQPDFVDPSDKLVAEAFLGLGQNHPVVNPSEHTGQFWAGGMTQYGAQYDSGSPLVGKPIMVRFWDTPRDQILALHNDPVEEPSWGEYSGGMTLPAVSTDWVFIDEAGSNLYTDQQAAPAGPVLSVSPTSLSFSAIEGGENPPSQTIQVWNSGQDTLDWVITENIDWLSVSPDSGSSSGERDDVQVSVTIGTLPAATYSGTITVSAEGAQGSPQPVAVTLEITSVPTPALSCSPNSFSFSAIEGGSNPVSQTLRVWNSGDGSLDWSIGEDIPWLSVSPMSGSSSGEEDDVSVSVDISGLSAGDYSGGITVSAPGAAGSPETIDVTLQVTPPGQPELAVDPASLSFWGVEGGINPPGQTLQIWNAGGGSLNWSVEEDIAWLSASPTSGSSTGEKDEVQVSVDIAGLPAGTYSGAMTVLAPDAAGSPTVIDVSLQVYPRGQLVYFGWGTDDVIGGEGYALYSDANLTQRLQGTAVGGSFDTNDYAQLIIDLDGDGFSAPDFTRPNLVDPSDMLLSEAFIGLKQNTPAVNPSEQTGQFWAGGMTQYGAQYSSDALWVGRPVMVRFWDMPKGQIRAAYQDPLLEPHWGEYSGGMLLPAVTADWSFTESAASDLYTDQSPPGPPPIGELVYFGWGTDKVIAGEGYALYSDAAFTQRLEGIGIGGSFDVNDYVQLIVDLDGNGFAQPDFTRSDFVDPSDKLLGEAFVGLSQNSPVVNPDEHTGQFWAGGFTQFGAQYNSVDPWVGKPILVRFWSAPKAAILGLYQANDSGLRWGEYSGGMTLPDTTTDWSFTDHAQSDLYTSFGINRPPILSEIGDKEVDENQQLTFVVSATDPDGTVPTLAASNLPGGATFLDNGDGSGTFEWTPTYEQAGVYPGVHFEASDGVLTDTEEITITVNDVNRAPVLYPIGDKQVDAGQLLSFTVSAIDPDGTTPILTAGNLPAGANFVDNGDGTGTFTWTPTGDQVGVHPDVLFEATDGLLSDSESIAIEVKGVANRPPVLAPITNKIVYENHPLGFTVSATDPDGTTPALTASNLPEGATFADNGDGTGAFNWTPTYEQAGNYHNIVFEASDGELTDSQAIYITVVDVNRPPVLSPIGSKQGIENQVLSFTVSATDPEGTIPTLTASNLPQGSTFTDNQDGTGTFTWTPAPDQIGDYPGVHFEASDGELTSSEDILITVISGRPPVILEIAITAEGKLRLTWERFGTGLYTVQFCSDMPIGVWQDLPGGPWPIPTTTWEGDIGPTTKCFLRVGCD